MNRLALDRISLISLLVVLHTLLSVDGAVSNVQLTTSPPCTFTPSWNGAGTYTTGVSVANTASSATMRGTWPGGDTVTLWVNGAQKTPFTSNTVSGAIPLGTGVNFGLPCSCRTNLIGWYPLMQSVPQADYSGQSRTGIVVGSVGTTNDHLGNAGLATTFSGSQSITVVQAVPKDEMAISV